MSNLPIEQRVFDRLIEFDEKSRGYPIRTMVPEQPVTKMWGRGPILDQGQEGACVGFGWSAELGAEPFVVSVDGDSARSIYHRAQELDDYPETPPEEGSSVLAGAKAVVERGFMGEYRWAFGIDDVILALGHHGPVVFGTVWTSEMGSTDAYGRLSVGGGVRGGHCWCGVGVVIDQPIGGEVDTWIVGQNSWGTDWGDYGLFYIRARDLSTLLKQEGEACVPITRTAA